MQETHEQSPVDWRIFWSGIGIGLSMCGAIAIMVCNERMNLYRANYSESAASLSGFGNLVLGYGAPLFSSIAVGGVLWPIIVGLIKRRALIDLWPMILANGVIICILGGAMVAAQAQNLAIQLMLLGK